MAANTITRRQALAIIKKVTPNTGVSLRTQVPVSHPHFNGGTNEIQSPLDAATIAHEAIHARQFKNHPKLMTVAKLAPWAGFAGSGVLSMLKKRSSLHIPKFAPTALVAVSYLPTLAIETQANREALKHKGGARVAASSMGSYLTTAGLSTGVTALGDLGVFDQMAKNSAKRIRIMKRLRQMHRGYSVDYARIGPRMRHGGFRPITDTLRTPIFRTTKWAKTLPSKTLSISGRVAIGALSTAGAYGVMHVMKHLIDTIKEHHHNSNIPDVRADVELIPTYHGQISPLVYSLGPIPVVAEVAEHMNGVRTMSTPLLTSLQSKLKSFASGAKSMALRNMCSFWLGMVTSELLGRGVTKMMTPPIVLNTTTANPNEVKKKFSHSPKDELLMYVNWGEMAEGVLPKIKSWGSTALKAGKAVMGMGGAKTVASVGGSMAETALAGKAVKKGIGSRIWKGLGTAEKIATPVFAAGAVSDIHRNLKANRQMNEWDQSNHQSSAGPPTTAWNPQGYSSTARIHRMASEAMDNEIDLDTAGKFDPMLHRALMKESILAHDSEVMAKESSALWKTSRTRRNKQLAIGAALGASAIGAGFWLKHKRKKYNLPHNPFGKRTRAIGEFLSSELRGISRSASALKDTTSKPVNDVRNKLADAIIDLERGKNNKTRTILGKTLRKVRSDAQKVSNRLMIDRSIHVPPMETPKGLLSSPRSRLLAGAGGGAVLSGGYEVGRKMGKHEERGRLRKLSDMEAI